MRTLAWIKDKLAPPVRVPPSSRTPLTVAPEDAVLARAADVAAGIEPPQAPGLIERVEESVHIPGDQLKADFGHAVAGDSVPAWGDGAEGALAFGVNLCRVPSVHYAPGFGAVINGRGRVFHSTVREAVFLTPDLSLLPGAEIGRNGEALFAPLPGAPRRSSASVFMAWGGLSNYGHFLLDCLPGLALYADRDLLDRFPPLAPPLSVWHRQLLALMLGEQAGAVEEVAAPLLQVEDLLFTSCMDHFLHAPNRPLDRVRARILDRAPAGEARGRRLYLTRRGMGKRVLVNEAELEAALLERGFEIVQAEHLSVEAQVALFRHAEAVVAPTGAALANALFMAPGAKVFEIQPANYMGIWVRMLCRFVGVRWHGYFTSSPLRSGDETAQPQVDWLFDWLLPVDDFLLQLDARL